nr:hypothetical protein GCM10020093_115130 [Planobispora longispora]
MFTGYPARGGVRPGRAPARGPAGRTADEPRRHAGGGVRLPEDPSRAGGRPGLAEERSRPGGRPGGRAGGRRPGSVPEAPARAGASAEGLPARLRELLGRPLFSYHLLLGVSALLVALGLMMVLSASSVEALQETGDPFYWFLKQSISAAIGIPIMWACSRLPVRFFRLAGYPLMALSIIGLVMVLFVGTSQLGAQRWIDLGPIYLQPSEPAKLGLLLWGADLLSRRARNGVIEWRHLFIPLMPGTAIMAVMVMLGSDLGTTIVLLAIFLALLWVVGAPLRLFGGILGVAVLATVVMIVTEGYRSDRIEGWLNPGPTPTARATRRSRDRSRWAAAAGSGSGWGPAGRSGTGSRTPRATSSSPSSARSSA